MISGPDYLGKIDPSGQVTEYVGVTNLNMGEVAAIKGREGQFGGGLTNVAPVTVLTTLAGEVSSLARDPWSGRVYASLDTLDIVSFAADGTDLQVFQVAPALGRIALAPDGYLYHLTLGWPTQPAIVRWELPASL